MNDTARRLLAEVTRLQQAGALAHHRLRAMRWTPPPSRCPWCQEDAGWCASTGGTRPCEGQTERAGLLAQAEHAPEVTIHAEGGQTMILRCNACRGEVRWDADTPGHQCGDPNCGCHTDGLRGAYVHVGEDCGQFWWAIRDTAPTEGEAVSAR